MFLHSALEAIALRFDLDARALTDFADEDEHSGWDKGAGAWPIGSLWRVEGQVLYALVRALQPDKVLELGTGHGCSATHLATALQRNGSGVLHGVDNEGDPTAVGRIGAGIPVDLHPLVTIYNTSIEQFITMPDATGYDLIYEDGIHSPWQVQAVWEHIGHLLNPGGVIVSHDAMHYIVGADVRHGIEAAGIGDALYLSIEPSDCGLALWRKPGTRPAAKVVVSVEAEAHPIAPKRQAAPRKRAKKA